MQGGETGIASELKQGFVLGEWTVRPMAGLLQRNGHVVHLEPKVMDVLLCLARHQGEVVTRDILLAEVWGKVIVTDDAITRCISELRTVLGDISRERNYIRTIPRRGYSLLVPVGPLPGTIETGVEPALPPPSAQPRLAPRQPLKRWPIVALVVLVGAGLALWPRAERPQAPVAATPAPAGPATPMTPAPPRSVAVLPFVNLSGDPKHGYFTDGLSEDIRAALMALTALRVAARTSSEVFRDQPLDVREIASRLNVDAILEGTVRIIDERVRVTAQLTDARNGYALWASSFERGLADRMQLQSDVAQDIVKRLEPALREPGRALAVATANVEARDLYQLGRHHWHARTAESTAQAVQYFERAIALDPNYALAHAGLSDALIFSAAYGGRPIGEVESRARSAADTALRIDPDLAEAHAALGLMLRARLELDGARAALERAVELKPQYSMAQMWLAMTWADQGDLQGAHRHFALALEVDPLHPIVQGNYADSLMNLGRYDEAFTALAKFIRLNPAAMLLKAHMSGLLALGRYDELLAFSVGHSFTAEYRPYTSAPVIEALIELQRYADAERMVSDNSADMEAWHRYWLEARLAMAQRDVAGLRRLGTTLSAPQAGGYQGDMHARCAPALSAYLSGIAAYLEGAEVASHFVEFDTRRKADGCVVFLPELLISAALYPALAAQAANADAQALLDEAARRVAAARRSGWDTPSLAVLTAALAHARGDGNAARTALQTVTERGWQTYGYMKSSSLYDRLLDATDVAPLVAGLERHYQTIRGRSGAVTLAKLGL